MVDIQGTRMHRRRNQGGGAYFAKLDITPLLGCIGEKNKCIS